MSGEKDTLRGDLIKQFNSEFPESPLEEMDKSELAEIRGWITTGNYSLNWIISKGLQRGLPLGRVVLFSGDPSSGKSMVALSMMREPSIDLIIYMDSEGGGVTRDFATFLGIDPAKVLYSTIDTVEDLISKMRLVIDIVEKNKANKNILMIVDSISMVTTEKEKDPKAGADMGNRAKLTRSFFRQYIRKMQKLNICAVFTAHLTDNIGGYGPKKMVAGGTILGFAPSVEVRYSSVNAEAETEQSAKGTQLVKIRAEIIKSRLGTARKRVKFDLDMQKGLDPYAGLFDILNDYQFVIPALANVDEQIKEKKIPKKSSGWWMFVPWDTTFDGMFNKLVEVGALRADSRKFRESKIKEWARDYEWFIPEMQKILDSIYTRDLTQDAENQEKETEEVEEEGAEVETLNEEKTKKNKKSPKVEITEVT